MTTFCLADQLSVWERLRLRRRDQPGQLRDIIYILKQARRLGGQNSQPDRHILFQIIYKLQPCFQRNPWQL